MTKQNKLTLSLSPDIPGIPFVNEKENLEWLSNKLGFGGNISRLVQHIARATETSPVDFANAMERAFSVAAGIEED